MRFSFARRNTAWLVPIAVISFGILASPIASSIASAANPPQWAYSFYMSTTDQAHLENKGCSLGQKQGNGGMPDDALVILDFGGPRDFSDGSWGASLFSGADAKIGEIKGGLHYYAEGYYRCAPGNGQVKIAVGTTNDFLSTWGSTRETNHGQAWGQMINDLNDYITQSGHVYASKESFAGASDMELGFAGPGDTKNWVQGFKQGVNQWNLFDYGDAAGCSQTSGSFDACEGAWSSGDVEWISWGSQVSNPAPEIYNESSANADQWFRLSKYAVNQTNDGSMNFVTALSQAAACNGGCPGTDNSPAQAWNQLYNDINPGDTSDDIRWSSNIDWD